MVVYIVYSLNLVAMKSLLPSLFFLLLSNGLLAQDTIRFQLCAELWKDNRPIKGAVLSFQPINPSFPYSPQVFLLDSSQSCVDMTVVLSDYLPGTTFEYSAAVPDTGYLNGVSVIDLCKISQHILGINPLPSPYSIVAADANRSGSVNTFDIVELRKLILGVYMSLPNNSAWRFIADYCMFPNPNNPFQQPCFSGITSTELAALNNDTAKVVGIKIGDVDGDASLNGAPYFPPIVTDSITLVLPQGQLSAGVPTAIPVKFDKNFDLGSLQAQFFLDPSLARYDSISDGKINVFSPTSAAYDTLSGALRFSASGYFNFFVPADTALFYIHLTPLQSANLTTVLKVVHDDPDMMTFAVGSNCGLYYTIGSTYHGFVSTHSPELQGLRVQVPSPNPFVNQTSLVVELENAETALLEVFDLSGRILYSQEKNLPSGVNCWEIPGPALVPGSLGIWRLRIGAQMVTGKLVRR